MPTIVSLLSKDKFASAGLEIPEGWNVRFPEHYSEKEIIRACEGADCLFTAASAAKISSTILENIPSVKIVQTMGVGVDHIDIPAAIRLGIPVANVPGANATTVAEYTIGALIALQRRMAEADLEIKAGNYTSFRNRILGAGLGEIRGSNFGIIGFGNIGRQVAKIAVLLGASVSYFNRNRQSSEIERQFTVEYKPFDLLLSTSNIVSLHMPLTNDTRGVIGKRELALMPRGSLLINTARGEVVDQAALAEALESGHLGGAIIDTFAPEPPDPSHPLLHLSPAAASRLLLTPHLAGVTVGSYKRMIGTAIANMERAIHGEMPEHIVNGVRQRI